MAGVISVSNFGLRSAQMVSAAFFCFEPHVRTFAAINREAFS
jgi:hypothetical protein